MLEIQRGIKEEEIAFAVLLLRGCWKERGMIYTQQWAEQYLRQGHKIELKKEQWFLVKEEGKVIGIISVILWEGNVAEIRDRIIKKEAQQKGYERKIIQYAKEWCKINSARKIYTLVPQIEKLLYEEMGFRLEGFLQDHFKQGEDLLIMSFFPEKKQDIQMNLKEKLEDMRKMESIEEETSTRLRMLNVR